MALKSVVVDRFFEDVILVSKRLQDRKGPLSLVLLSSSHHHSLWDLTIAAPWMDRMSPLKAGAEIASFFKENLQGAGSKLGRIKIRATNDLLVRSLTSNLDIPHLGTAYGVSGLDLDLFSLDEAVCLLSRPVAANHVTEKVSA